MNDRELLELAAKAAGIELTFSYDEDTEGLPYILSPHGGACFWNPLTDDGDALRLVVKLGLTIVIESDMVFVRNKRSDKAFREASKDHYTSTRRAIVRAAAEIGKGIEMNDQIKEVALRMAMEVHKVPKDELIDPDFYVEFLTRCLAELEKDAEPVYFYRMKDSRSDVWINTTKRYYDENANDNYRVMRLYTHPQTIEAAVLQEREECAKVCDEYADDPVYCGAAIRARTNITIKCAAGCGASVPVMAKDEGEDHLCDGCDNHTIKIQSCSITSDDPITPQDIAYRLEELADDMTEIASLMDYYGGFSEMGRHGRELAGAAMIARQWAGEIECDR